MKCRKCKAEKPETKFRDYFADNVLHTYCFECRVAPKTCTKCGETKQITEFGKLRNSTRAYCNTCNVGRLKSYGGASEKKWKKLIEAAHRSSRKAGPGSQD